MLSHRYKPRLEMTVTEGNILMTQIRAEKKVYGSGPQVPLGLSSHRSPLGKKTFKDILFKPTLSPSHKENSARNFSPYRGKRIIGETINLPQERSHSGRKHFENKSKNVESVVSGVESQRGGGRRRFDHSPNHQHMNTTLSLRWN